MDRKLNQKSTPPQGHAWERCNSIVIAWLHNVVDKNLHGSVAYAEIAEELWYDLKDRYSQGNEICIHQLKRDITLTNQGSLSVREHFTKLKILWDELGRYRALPSCNCTKDFNLNRFVEGERVHQFLMGLDTEQFGTVRSNLLAMEPLPTLNKAYAVVLREERQQFLAKGMENKKMVAEPSASTFKASSMNRSRNPNRPRCTYCQKLGHERSQCFEIVRYPPNWQSRRPNRGSQEGFRLGGRNSEGAMRDGGDARQSGKRHRESRWHPS